MNPLSMKLLVIIISFISGAHLDDNVWSGTDMYYTIINSANKADICKFITCNEPYVSNKCPEGTEYQENFGVYGCCGECVAFRNDKEYCTGSLQYFAKHTKRAADKKLKELLNHDDNASKENVSVANTTETDDLILTELKNINVLNSEPILYEVNNTVRSLWCGGSIPCKNDECEIDIQIQNCITSRKYYDEQVGSKDPNVYVSWRDDYRWRPVCLRNGDYGPKQCKGSNNEEKTCVCVNPQGDTIYGKAFEWQTELYDPMNCLCSRKRWEREAAGELVTLHCTDNGNFDPVQCEKGWCYCVDPETGDAYGTQLPEQTVTMLPCYNSTLFGDIYMRRCDSQLYAHQAISESLAAHGVHQTPTIHLTCDFDGSYGSLQKATGSITGYYCIDKYNDNNYKLSPAGEGCKCARDLFVMTAAGLTTDIQCKTSSGAYQPEQKKNGYSFCVDEDGIRAGPLLRQECVGSLQCNNAKTCQTGQEDTTSCQRVCDNCPDDAYVFNPDFNPVGEC